MTKTVYNVVPVKTTETVELKREVPVIDVQWKDKIYEKEMPQTFHNMRAAHIESET